MRTANAALRTYETLTALHALPDRAALTTAEAALFLRLSPKTMERMRLDGSGPRYIQAGARGARGGNQKCLYLKADLLAWQLDHQVSTAMEAAIRKGQALKTLYDLVAEAPFYLDVSERIIGSAEDTPLNVVLLRLGSLDVVWLPVAEAAGREWVDPAAHQSLARDVKSVLSMEEQRLTAALNATSIGVEIRR
ncbi:TPA: hypothetical protein QDB14_002547 [Burkholderia vietnamiensis]|nr:hypothetical protein [Burkholderia vietnamiensis]HEP6274477.1 hypothetical protein [Burkholderia vietnamiensis]HEP6283976.1 hypothetical protein [Burkholderia vietnamiensis]HEP6309442.1 hypothetical protein [Burkholderia vietnamiensis]